MPTYQFQCTACAHGFEVIQSFEDNAVPNCPECNGATKKVYGGIGVLFKGPGFYKTDSRPPASGSSAD